LIEQTRSIDPANRIDRTNRSIDPANRFDRANDQSIRPIELIEQTINRFGQSIRLYPIKAFPV